MKISEKTKKTLRALIFNIAETALIILMGLALKLPITYIIILMLTFIVCRGCFGTIIHFKDWYRCLVWSSLLMLSLFVLLKVDLVVSIMFAIFSAYILTERSNMKSLYMWNNHGEPSKYQDIVEYIKYNQYDDRLIEFEKKLKDMDTIEYLIYKYRFKEGKTFGEISDLLDMESPRIAERLEKVAFAIRIYCKI